MEAPPSASRGRGRRTRRRARPRCEAHPTRPCSQAAQVGWPRLRLAFRGQILYLVERSSVSVHSDLSFFFLAALSAADRLTLPGLPAAAGGGSLCLASSELAALS